MSEASNESRGRLARARNWLQKRPVEAAIWAVVAGLILFAVVRTFRLSWTPVFDNGGIWMRSWDVGTRNTPLTGPPSRFGWHHPGPMLFYLLAPLLRAFRGLPNALLVSMLAIALASAVGTVVLAARSAGKGTALILALGTAVVSVCYGDRLIDPWNPHTVVLPFTLFLVAAWLFSSGEAVAAPVAVVTGTFAAQSHLGAVPAVAIIAVTALVLRLFPGRLPRASRGRRFWGFTALLVLILWAPLVIEQFSAGGGNLTRLLEFIRDPASGPTLGWTKGFLIAGYELLPWGPWIGRERLTLFFELAIGHWWDLAATASPLLVALVLALRFRDGLGIRLVALGFASIVACGVAHAQTRGLPLAYLTLWSRPMAMMIAAAPFVVLVRKYAGTVEDRLQSGAAQLAAGAIVCSALAIRVMFAGVPQPDYSRVYERITRSAWTAFPRGTTVRVVIVGSPFTASAEALMVALDRGGRIGKMQDIYAFEMGAHRVVSDKENLPTLMLAFGVAVEYGAQPEDGRIWDQHDPLSAQERKEMQMLREKLERDLRAGGKEDLVPGLREGASWVWFSIPTTVNTTELVRYFALASGIEKLPWVLYAVPPRPW